MKFKCSLVVMALTSLSVHADVAISGFASINAGKVLSGTGVPHYGVEPTFLADYPIVSAYTKDFSFKPESLIGLQVSADLSEGLSVTGQLVARGADNYNAEFEWAYISYELNDSWTVQAGKKRLPLFYYSDFYDVGYAYVWMRPPADNYTWQIFNYEGINFLYNGSIGDWSMSANIYAGREDDPNNKLLSDFFFQKPTREIWEDILGGVATFSKDWLEVRVTHMQYTKRRFTGGEEQFWDGKNSRDGKFYGLAANADFGNFFILSEFNRLDLDGNLDTYMLSAGYRIGALTPYVMISDFKQDGDGDVEKHSTKAIGLRWDFHPSAGFKVQYDSVTDDSYDLAVAGDSKAITFGVDVVF